MSPLIQILDRFRLAAEIQWPPRTGAAVMEQAQRDKLLSVRPVSKGVCRVQTTEAGLLMLRGGR